MRPVSLPHSSAAAENVKFSKIRKKISKVKFQKCVPHFCAYWHIETCVPSFVRIGEQELSYRQQIVRQLRTQYVEGTYRHKYYTVTLTCGLKVTEGH